MSEETNEWLVNLFGTGYRQSKAQSAPEKVSAAYQHVADNIRARLETIGKGDELDEIDSDLLGALVASLSAHQWTMLGINTFNTKEVA